MRWIYLKGESFHARIIENHLHQIPSRKRRRRRRSEVEEDVALPFYPCRPRSISGISSSRIFSLQSIPRHPRSNSLLSLPLSLSPVFRCNGYKRIPMHLERHSTHTSSWQGYKFRSARRTIGTGKARTRSQHNRVC